MNENNFFLFGGAAVYTIMASLMAFDENRTQSALSLHAYDVILSSIISCVSTPTMFMCHQMK